MISHKLGIGNPDITPVDGVVEGDSFELTLQPKDETGATTQLSAIDFKHQHGDANSPSTNDYTIADFAETQPNGIWTYKITVTLGAYLNQFQMISTGSVVATDLAHVHAHPLVIA